MSIDFHTIQELCLRGESSSLDYKKEQYLFANAEDEKKTELLKDILAMANAFRSDTAYILIGVTQLKDGTGAITGIPKSVFIDDAHLQQFIDGKVNRRVVFQTYSVCIPDESNIIQVIEIPIQMSRPYELKKQFASIPKNIVYLRVGSSTRIATNDDIAKMGADNAKRSKLPQFEITLSNPYTKQTPVEEIMAITFHLDKLLFSNNEKPINDYRYLPNIFPEVSMKEKYEWVVMHFRQYDWMSIC